MATSAHLQEVDSVDDVRADIERRGVDLVGESFAFEAIGRRLAFFRDASGSMI
jgi:hypothetical protein